MIRTALLCCAAVACAGSASAAAADAPIAFELTVALGADWRYASDLVDTRVAPHGGIDIAVLRAAPARTIGLWPMGLSIGERGDALGSARGEVATFVGGIVFGVVSYDQHDLRLTIGPAVITADRSGDGVYRHATAVGAAVALDYRWWLRDRATAVGARLADDQAVVGRGGERRSIGDGSLAATLTERF